MRRGSILRITGLAIALLLFDQAALASLAHLHAPPAAGAPPAIDVAAGAENGRSGRHHAVECQACRVRAEIERDAFLSAASPAPYDLPGAALPVAAPPLLLSQVRCADPGDPRAPPVLS
ncbi:MAG: hypothetical protein ACQGVC_19015 [Myxococcota bacterium]